MTTPIRTADRVMLLMALVPYLREHGPTTVDDLALAFDVAPDLLRKLVRFLGVAGIPGETMTYQHEDLFDLDWDALERDDVVHLTHTVAVDDTPRFSSRETAALIAGLQVLRSVLPEPMRSSAERAAQKLSRVEPIVESAPQLSVSDEVSDDRVRIIAEAIHQRRQLRFTYRALAGSVTDRQVDPLVLHQRGDRWYLRAYCHTRDDRRTFFLDGMSDLMILSEEVTHTASDEDHVLFSPEFGSVTAHLRVRPQAVHLLADFLPNVGEHDAQGWVHCTVELHDPHAAVKLVQSAPGQVMVVAPEPAREAVRRWAEEALAAYEE